MTEKKGTKEMKRNGFTLMEMLIVICILGILISVFVPTCQNVMKKKAEARANPTQVTTSDASGQCMCPECRGTGKCETCDGTGRVSQNYRK